MSVIKDKKDLKRSKILEAAYELFSNRSVSSTPIDEVVKMAGVAKGTFYLYFKDKYDLVNQIVAYKGVHLFSGVIEDLNELRQTNELTIQEEIHFLVDRFIDNLSRNPSMLSMINKNISTYFTFLIEEGPPIFQNEKRKIVEYYANLGHTEDEIIKAMYIAINMVSSVCYDAILIKLPFTIDEIKPSIHDSIDKLLI